MNYELVDIVCLHHEQLSQETTSEFDLVWDSEEAEQESLLASCSKEPKFKSCMELLKAGKPVEFEGAYTDCKIYWYEEAASTISS